MAEMQIQETLRVLDTQHNYRCTCPIYTNFSREKIGCFSKEKDGIYLDQSMKRYYSPPSDPEDVLFDLKMNFETYVQDNQTRDLNKLLKWFQKQADSDKGQGPVPADFITRRGLLTKLMKMPYIINNHKANQQLIEVEAMKHDGEIYMTNAKRSSDGEELLYYSYTGRKFETFITTYERGMDPDPEAPLVESNGFFIVMKAKIGNHTLNYAGEVDCCEIEENGNETFMQIHTCSPLAEPPRYFQSLKMQNWWAQNTLLNVPKIKLGIKDHDYIVYGIEDYLTENLPVICQEVWHPCISFTFLDQFLSFVKKNLEDDDDEDQSLYRFKFQPSDRRVHVSKTLVSPENSLLPEWYS